MITDSDPIVNAVVLLVEHHAPDRWDTAGIRAQVRNLLAAGIRACDVATAACNAADDPKANTPAAMTWTQHRPRSTATAPLDHGPQCNICGRPRDKCLEYLRKHPDHEYEPIRKAG